MSVTADDVRAKANGFIASLARLGAKERAQKPSGHFCQDYNRLRAMAIEVMADKEESMPPALMIQPGVRRGELICEATYAEIFAYAQQILQHLGNLPIEEDAE